jgi:hypothetical protein
MRCAAAALAAARAAEATAASAMTDEEALALFRLSLSEPEPERDPPLARSSASDHVGVVGGVGRRRQQKRDSAAHFASR